MKYLADLTVDGKEIVWAFIYGVPGLDRMVKSRRVEFGFARVDGEELVYLMRGGDDLMLIKDDVKRICYGAGPDITEALRDLARFCQGFMLYLNDDPVFMWPGAEKRIDVAVKIPFDRLPPEGFTLGF